jgi:hypothetical protein
VTRALHGHRLHRLVPAAPARARQRRRGRRPQPRDAAAAPGAAGARCRRGDGGGGASPEGVVDDGRDVECAVLDDRAAGRAHEAQREAHRRADVGQRKDRELLEAGDLCAGAAWSARAAPQLRGGGEAQRCREPVSFMRVSLESFLTGSSNPAKVDDATHVPSSQLGYSISLAGIATTAVRAGQASQRRHATRVAPLLGGSLRPTSRKKRLGECFRAPAPHP